MVKLRSLEIRNEILLDLLFPFNNNRCKSACHNKRVSLIEAKETRVQIAWWNLSTKVSKTRMQSRFEKIARLFIVILGIFTDQLISQSNFWGSVVTPDVQRWTTYVLLRLHKSLLFIFVAFSLIWCGDYKQSIASFRLQVFENVK